MPNSPKRPARPKAPPVPPDRVAAIEGDLAKVREANHARANREQLAAVIAAEVTKYAAAHGPVEPAAKSSDVPLWLKIAGAALSLMVAGGVVIGAIWNLAIAPIGVRVSALEVAKTETSTALANNGSRLLSVDGRLTALDTQVATAARLRDQQQQGIVDRMRSLELSDQAASQQVSQLSQTLAGLVARIEEMLRRQERLENRLTGTRNQNDEGPVLLYIPNRGT